MAAASLPGGALRFRGELIAEIGMLQPHPEGCH